MTDDLDAARTLVVDGQTRRVVDELRSGGVEPILLKGPSLAAWLYSDRTQRSYNDTDLLIAPSDEALASGLLESMGYTRRLSLPSLRMHATTWNSPRSGPELDLHTTIWGWGGGEDVWRVLQGHTRTMRVANLDDVRVMDEPAMAVHVVTHALQNSYLIERANIDLERALDQVPDSVWADATSLAAEAGAAEAFAVGLQAREEGRALSVRLGIQVPDRPSPEIAFAAAGTRYTGGPVLESLRTARGVSARIRILRDRLAPPHAWVEHALEFHGMEIRGRVSNYARYWGNLIRKTPGAFRAWRAAR